MLLYARGDQRRSPLHYVLVHITACIILNPLSYDLSYTLASPLHYVFTLTMLDYRMFTVEHGN
jgi:hypothetical protein